jgi:hypothetical protein
MLTRLLTELEQNGIVMLPGLLSQEQLKSMQAAFDVRLRRIRWNDFDGYEKTERYRHMVQDILLLDQGFLDVALHPLVTQLLQGYLGSQFELVEAKGWETLATKTDFHGWHGDAWYDQKVLSYIPKEVKLAVYLTDVQSGAFTYIKGSHRKQHPRPFRSEEVKDVPCSAIVEVKASAGSACLFDTSGMHRQGIPVLQARRAVFYNYHDPNVPLQQEDIAYYRYHPLLLNAAFLGNLSEEDRRILGFGNKTNFIHAFERKPKHTLLHKAIQAVFDAKIPIDNFQHRVVARLKRMFGH